MSRKVANWPGLPNELLATIFNKLLLSDHPSFISVCRCWRDVGLKNNALCRQFLGLVVPGKTMCSETRRLLEPTLVESKYYYNNDINFRNISVPHSYHCCGSGFGWLVLIDDSLGMHLLNPLSNSKIQLPSLASVFDDDDDDEEHISKYDAFKAHLSCSPLSSSSQKVVMISCRDIWAFCRLGNRRWARIVPSQRINLFNIMDAIYYRGLFYMVCHTGLVAIVNIDHPIIIEYAPIPPGEKYCSRRYLVQSRGELFQVRRSVHADNESIGGSESECEHEPGDDNTDEHGRGYRTCKIKIFRLTYRRDGSDGGVNWRDVKSIGDRAFFIGQNTSFSVSASDVIGCRPNSIYFSDDSTPFLEEPIRHDVGVYKVDERSIEEIYPTNSEPIRPAPFWFVPCLRST